MHFQCTLVKVSLQGIVGLLYNAGRGRLHCCDDNLNLLLENFDTVAGDVYAVFLARSNFSRVRGFPLSNHVSWPS